MAAPRDTSHSSSSDSDDSEDQPTEDAHEDEFDDDDDENPASSNDDDQDDNDEFVDGEVVVEDDFDDDSEAVIEALPSASEEEADSDNDNQGEDNSDGRTEPTLDAEEEEEDEEESDDNDIVPDGEETKAEEAGDGFLDEVPLLPAGEAQEGDEEAQEQAKTPNETVLKDPMIKPLIIFMVVAVLLSAIIFPILYLVVLPNKEKSDSNSNNNNNGDKNPDNNNNNGGTATPAPSNTLAPIAWAWDLPEDFQTVIEDDRTSSTAKAYDWVAADPQFETYPEARLQQRFGMAGLYYAAGGANWTTSANNNWLSYEVAECQWTGITCVKVDFDNSTTTTTPTTTITTNANETDENIFEQPTAGRRKQLRRKLQEPLSSSWDQVRTLKLPKSNLQGRIPAELALLTKLLVLDLSQNSLMGSIPPSVFQNLVELSTVNLRSNSLEDLVPSELGLLEELVTMDLSNNVLSGELPGAWDNLDKLRTLHLQDNMFEGNLPTSFANLDGIRTIDVSYNSLTGPLPPRIGALTLLKDLHLHNNMLTAEIPNNMSLMRELESLLLNSNKFRGTVPQSLERLYSEFKLQRLDLSNNPMMMGEMPELLCNVTNLTFTCVPEPEMPSLCGCDCPCFNGTYSMEDVTSFVNGTDVAMNSTNATMPAPESSTDMTGNATIEATEGPSVATASPTSTAACTPLVVNIGVDVQLVFPDEFFLVCLEEEDALVRATIQESLNTNFPIVVTNWDGNATFGTIEFEPQQSIDNTNPFARRALLVRPDTPNQGKTGVRYPSQLHATIHSHSEESTNRQLQELCQRRPTPCPETANYCLFGCGVAATTQCEVGDTPQLPPLGAAVAADLAALNLECMGAPNPPTVVLNTF